MGGVPEPQRLLSPSLAPRWALARDGLLGALTLGLAVSITLAEAALAGLALWLLLAPRGRDRPPLRWPLALPLAAFAAWTLVAALAAARPLDALAAARSLLWLGTMYVVLGALPDRAAAHRFAWGLFLAVALVGLLGVIQVAACPREPPALPVLARLFRKCRRAHGFYSIYMTLAGVLTLVLAATLPRLLQAGHRLRWAGPAWVIGVAGLAVTYTRGAWVGFAAAVVGCALAVRRRVAVFAVLAGMVVVALVALPGVWSRASTIADPADDTARERVAMLRAGLRLAAAHPLTGVGPGQVKHVYPEYAPPEARRRSTSHLHDTPLQIVVERGVPGLALWLALFAAFFARTIRILRRVPPARPDDGALVLGVVLAIGAFLLAGLFEYNFGDTEVLLVACALMALPFVLEREMDRESGRGWDGLPSVGS